MNKAHQESSMPGKRKRPHYDIDFTLRRVFGKRCFRSVFSVLPMHASNSNTCIDQSNAKSLPQRSTARMSFCRLRHRLGRACVSNYQLSSILVVRSPI